MRDEWRDVALGEVLALDLDGVHVEPDVEYRLAGVYGFGRGLFSREPLRGSATSYKQLNRLHSGQLVMSKLKAWEGAIAVVGDAFEGFVLSPEFPTFRISADVDPRFLSLVCSRPAFWEQLQLESRGMGGRRERVHPKRLLDVVVALPPFDQQKRVVDLLASVDDVIARAAGLTTSSFVLARSLLEHALDEAIAAGAPVREVRDLAVTKGLIGGPFGSSLGAKDYVADGVPVIRGANLSTGTPWVGGDFVFVSPSKAETLHRNGAVPGDVIATQRGTIGQVAIIPDGDHPSYLVSQSQMRLRVDPAIAHRDFVYLVLGSDRVRASLRERTIATANPHINLGIFASTPVVLPDLDEQARIAELVLGVREVAERSNATELKLSALRLSLLTDLLDGRHEISSSYDSLLEAS